MMLRFKNFIRTKIFKIKQPFFWLQKADKKLKKIVQELVFFLRSREKNDY